MNNESYLNDVVNGHSDIGNHQTNESSVIDIAVSNNIVVNNNVVESNKANDQSNFSKCLTNESFVSDVSDQINFGKDHTNESYASDLMTDQNDNGKCHTNDSYVTNVVTNQSDNSKQPDNESYARNLVNDVMVSDAVSDQSNIGKNQINECFISDDVTIDQRKHQNNVSFSEVNDGEANNIKEDFEGVKYDVTKEELQKAKIEKKDDRKETLVHKANVKLRHFFVNNALPIFFVIALIVGIFLPQIGNALNHQSTTYVCLVIIFIYSGLYLPTSAIKDSLKAYRAAMWGLLSILFLSCVIGGQLTMLVSFQETNPKVNSTYGNNSVPMESLKTGLVVYFSSPCTLSSGVLMVTQLNGNYALAVLLTVAANVAGIFTTPLLLKWMLKAGGNFNLDVFSLLINLLLSLLLPLVIGKLLRFVKVIKKFSLVPNHKLCFMLLDITALALIVLIQVSQTSSGGGLKKLTAVSTLIVISWSLAVHIMFLLVNAAGSWILRLEVKQVKCVVILSSQKTASIALAVLTFLPSSLGDRGLMTISIIIAHISMLLFDSILVPLWIYKEKRDKKTKKSLEPTVVSPPTDSKV